VALARTGAGGGVGGGAVVEVRGAGAAVGDAAALGRAVRNLVDNALRHADARVRVQVADGRVAVEDDGPGIPPDDRERVFERFVRLDEARVRAVGPEGADGAATGSGLGLAIARAVAREHGGDVRLADREDGAPGLRAVLDVPVRR
ncbi:ATP-binding protein, partial [Cellulomonas triticagri]